MSLRFEALHDPLSSPDRLVRILRPIIQPFVGVMLDTQHDLSPCCAIGSQLIGDDHTGHPSLTRRSVEQTPYTQAFIKDLVAGTTRNM